MSKKRKICAVIGSRANYSSIKSAMLAICDQAELELQLVIDYSYMARFISLSKAAPEFDSE